MAGTLPFHYREESLCTSRELWLLVRALQQELKMERKKTEEAEMKTK